MKPLLLLIGGLPGTGKSTLAHKIQGAKVFSADDFFETQEGGYQFDFRRLPEAHARCQEAVRDALYEGHPLVVVANTFSQLWEQEPYQNLAKMFGYYFLWVDLFDRGCSDADLAAQNIHRCPESSIKRMRERWGT